MLLSYALVTRRILKEIYITRVELYCEVVRQIEVDMLATSWFMWLNGGNAPAHFKLPSPQATNPALVVNALWQLPMSALLLVQRKELGQMEKYDILHLPSLSCFPLICVQLSGATFKSNFQEKLSRATFKSNFLEQLSRATS